MALGACSLLLAGVATASNANAVFTGNRLTGSNFEIDTNANLTVDGASPSIDWLSGGSGTSMRTGVVVDPDVPSGASDNSFGNGTKEDSAVPTVTDGSIPPNKSDLKNFGLFKEQSGAGSFLNLFWSRVQDPSGTTNMDFEFNQSSTLSSNGVTPVRTANDLLVTYDLANGGTVAVLSKRIWNGSAWGNAVALGTNAIGGINTTAIAATDAGVIGAQSARTFGEASINLASIFPSGSCTNFGYAYLKSRSSDSFTSAVKDFIAPQAVNLTNCGTVLIHKQDDAGTALANAGFTLYTNAAPLAGPRGIEDTATALTCSTSALGDCTISNVPFGSYWIVETSTPANHETAADQAVTVAVGGNTPTGTFTFVDPRQQGSIIVKKTDASGAALAGAGFTVTPGSLAMVEGTTGVFCLDGLNFAAYTVTESTVPFGYTGQAPKSVTVSTKSTCAARLAATVVPDQTFVNSPKPGTINVAKTDDATPGNPLGGAYFTLFQDQGVIGTYELSVDSTVQAGPTQTDSTGGLQFANVPLGSYCVVETGTPTGYDTAAAQCTTIDLATDGETVNLSFVDPRQHKIIVLVCHEGTNTLDPSSVALTGDAGSPKTSLAPGSLTAAQQAALCGLGGATYGGLSGHSARSMSVTPG